MISGSVEFAERIELEAVRLDLEPYRERRLGADHRGDLEVARHALASNHDAGDVADHDRIDLRMKIADEGAERPGAEQVDVALGLRRVELAGQVECRGHQAAERVRADERIDHRERHVVDRERASELGRGLLAVRELLRVTKTS